MSHLISLYLIAHCIIGAVLTMHEHKDGDEQNLRRLDFQQAALKTLTLGQRWLL